MIPAELKRLVTFRNRFIFTGYLFLFILVLFVHGLSGCSDRGPDARKRGISDREKQFYNGKGVGPVNNLVLESLLNDSMILNGEKIFAAKCVSCHHLTEERKIGPGLAGVTLRRRPEWILNQILNPVENVEKDSLARELLSIYLTQMVPMQVTLEDARDLLEYFRFRDANKNARE
jgi:hypothetical protein